METKETYIKPEITVIEMECPEVIAASHTDIPFDESYDNSPARSARRDFWGNGEE